MPGVWCSLKRSLDCKTEASQVHDPARAISARKQIKCGCSKSISDLRDLILCSKKHKERQGGGSSPRSLGSSEIVNPMTHEVTLNKSTCEFQITGFGAKKGASFEGTLKRQGTPGPRSHSARMSTSSDPSWKSSLGHAADFEGNIMKSRAFHETGLRSDSARMSTSSDPSWKRSLCHPGGSAGFEGSNVSNNIKSMAFHETGFNGASNLICQRCGEQLKDLEAVEVHHLSHHSVTELAEGDSSRKIVELICGTRSKDRQIERVLQVNNMQKTLAQFEEYREAVKIKASKLAKKHPRCLADGNELLRFHGTVVACSLGFSGPCTLQTCGVCKILRNGFSTTEHPGGFGVFTTCTSKRALESVERNKSGKRALIMCRVIAGRVHRPLENCKDLTGPLGFDSLAGKLDYQSNNIEELYLLDPKALLPCFVIICRP